MAKVGEGLSESDVVNFCYGQTKEYYDHPIQPTLQEWASVLSKSTSSPTSDYVKNSMLAQRVDKLAGQAYMSLDNGYRGVSPSDAEPGTFRS